VTVAKILVVDDSATDRRVAGGLLRRRSGWDVEFAADGREALGLVSGVTPDLVLTDLQMPEMNGLELVEAMRQQHPLVPVILMTAQGSESIAVEALAQGASSYVPKRNLADDLVEIVERVLSVAGERRTRRTLMQCLRQIRCSFVINNDPALLTNLVTHLQDLLHQMNVLPENERLRVGVALEEALLNAAYHGNLEVNSQLREEDHAAYYELARERSGCPPYCERSIYVDVELSPEVVQYVIRDEGPGFDPGELPDPTDPANLDRPCGRGLLLMRTFMDDVEYNPLGNEVTLVKYGVDSVVLAT
jgi:CheY-like chemotaxis protein/anti-sigma regulatory factor (Ser/Thr protein kinase)